MLWRRKKLLENQPKIVSEKDDSMNEEVVMGRTWTKKKFEVVDFDPKLDGDRPDCSSADSAVDGYADEDALNGVEKGVE